MILLHKILPVLLSPIFLIGLIAVIGAIRKSRGLVFVAVGSLYLLSTPMLANQIIRAIEHPFELRPSSSVTPADAIVVLSGMLMNVESTGGDISHQWGESADRFFGGLELLRAEKAPVLVWTGGRLPWDSHSLSEGELLMREALKIGFQRQQFLLTADVQNTAEEAKAVGELIGSEKSIVLVTSAFHMRRSLSLFRAQGFSVEPFAVDFRVSASRLTPMDFLPDAKALYLSSMASRELWGRLYYSLRQENE